MKSQIHLAKIGKNIYNESAKCKITYRKKIERSDFYEHKNNRKGTKGNRRN